MKTAPPRDASDDRPDIVFIITDQQRYDTIAALGFDYARTPNLDRLVREGVAFGQCHVTAASCAAARASLFKGYYPHTTGILKNADTWRHGWIERLNHAGYHCTNIGKMHTWPFDTEMGFHERYVVENKDRYLEGRYYFDEWDRALRVRGLVKQQRELYRRRDDYQTALGAFEWELPPELHPDMFVGDMATWWIDTKPTDAPLFLQIGFPGPHPPYDPVPRYVDHYAGQTELGILPVDATELAGQPAALDELRKHNRDIDHDSLVLDLHPSDAMRHRQRAFYLANVTMIDEKVGEILAALQRRGRIDNTIVIFTSDHGDCMTDHGHSQKWTMYDAITRVPMIVWAPGVTGPNAVQPGRCDALVQQMDLGPTILGWAGVDIPGDVEARSIADALRQPDQFKGRSHVFCEQSGDGVLTGCQFMSMVRNHTHKLIHFFESTESNDRPAGQLFDLNRDPDERVNLWNDPSYQTIKAELKDELLNFRIRSGLETKDWSEDWR